MKALARSLSIGPASIMTLTNSAAIVQNAFLHIASPRKLTNILESTQLTLGNAYMSTSQDPLWGISSSL
ncbi:Hypothetical protein NTJ_00069 [Nesidiocoris tenuis]|uniref:Uncharacterized protein n=1 Tax=Nesidiocoris tenuis TaxID=355587 RepID=A0ABN7A5A9_9HEMI|nr:Hypothetical protein NTJ_00069 [Nesidiocoris tenuis]